MDRRTLLKIGGIGLIGAGLSGCAARSGSSSARGSSSATLGRPPLRLAPVRADWDRIIRTTVGLRPHRPSGFRLAADRLDETTVIHNYGHGGSGMSLSWGTGRMAAEMALAHDGRRAAVIGCGAVGLTAARQLQRHGFDVTIYAMAVPPNTTSNMSMAGFTPTSGLVDGDLRSPAWEAQFREAAEISYRQLQLLVGRGYGVSWLQRYELRDDEPRASGQGAGEGDEEPLLPAHLRTGTTPLGPGEHPFPTRYANRSMRIRIEPSIYLDALVRDVVAFGGRIVIRKFTEPRELVELDESLVKLLRARRARPLRRRRHGPPQGTAHRARTPAGGGLRDLRRPSRLVPGRRPRHPHAASQRRHRPGGHFRARSVVARARPGGDGAHRRRAQSGLLGHEELTRSRRTVARRVA